VVSAHRRIRGERDLRPLTAELHEAGAVVAMPVV
jgi:hypothetical protein